MKIWTSSRTREKNRYAVRMAAGFAGIAALAVVLIASGAVLIRAIGLADSSVSSAALSGGDRALPLPDFASLPPRTARRACFYSRRQRPAFRGGRPPARAIQRPRSAFARRPKSGIPSHGNPPDGQNERASGRHRGNSRRGTHPRTRAQPRARLPRALWGRPYRQARHRLCRRLPG